MRIPRDAREGGFTLVELLVVVGIMGILVSIAFASYYVVTGRSRRIACLHNQRVFQGAMVIYETQNNGLPATAPADLKPYVDWPSANYGKCTADKSAALYIEDGIVKCPTPGHTE